ncbi:unnamed protein product [Phytomonas sp. Hart1]|nr:unnamed protein product [Phytomonas sp. Hart1]|eukprot:CCW71609.1 unnamed protein product [Phytomonas sp. isolate Hart1]
MVADPACAAQFGFIMKSLRAWVAEELREDRIPPIDARAILANGQLLFREARTISLVGGLARAGISDLHELKTPDTIISLMEAILNTNARAPETFWRQTLRRLIELNDELQDRMSGAMDFFSSSTNPEKGKFPDKCYLDEENEERPSVQVGHVFSGLSTRQIFRLLMVLRGGDYYGEIATFHNLADQALKNVVFETEAANFEESIVTTPTMVLLEHRVRLVSDLSVDEFLELLKIAGGFRIPFRVSAEQVSRHLLAPMVDFSNSDRLLNIFQVIRQTRCSSNLLFFTLAKKIQKNVFTAPYQLPLSKSFIKTILQEPGFLSCEPLVDFVEFFLAVCEYHITKLRATQLNTIAGQFYALSRHFSPISIVGLRIREVLHLICKQMEYLLKLGVVSPHLPTTLLEYTIILSMREDANQYPNVASLRAARDTAVKSAEKWGTKEENDVLCEAQKENHIVPTTSKRWELMREDEFPSVSKAAVHVYDEFIYIYERSLITRCTPTIEDIRRFSDTMEKTGLYNLLIGADCMRKAHIDRHVSNALDEKALLNGPFDSFPGWIEQRVSAIVRKKIFTARLTHSSSDDQILRVLGHLHCDSSKVRKIIDVLDTSILRILRSQRDVWSYVVILAHRFGTAEEQLLAEQQLKKALY